MKLTWFGGTTIRIHLGGKMIVADPVAVAGIDPEELVSGADLTVVVDGALLQIDPASWQPPRPGSMLDPAGELTVVGFAGGAIVAIAGEPPLLLAKASVPRVGRWGRDAVVVTFGDRADELAGEVLDRIGPRLIAVAGPNRAIDRAFNSLRGRLDGTGLVALEPGLGVEV